MIRINLLEVREERRKLAIRNLLVIAGAAWLVTLLGIFVWHQGLTSRIDSVKRQIVTERQEISRLDKIVGEVEQAQSQKQDLENKLEIIRRLEGTRGQMVMILMALSETMPQEVWARSLRVSGTLVDLKGAAVDMQSIGNYVKVLKDDPRFANPRTSGIRATGTRGRQATAIQAVDFDLTVEFVLPESAKEKS